MSFEPVQWNPSFEIGLQVVDKEHEGLLVRLNALIELLAANAPPADWLPELDRLITEVADHFAHEEQIMDNIAYPGYMAHRQQHQYLLQEVAQFRDKIAAESALEDTLSTVRFLKFWVLKHMVQEDSKIGQHIKRGLPADAR
jgi:hemerythrin-like metal-binding protein